MNTVKFYFGQWHVSWRFVILFAIISAVYTAVINQIPILKDTSFQDIAINVDPWILFAVFIIINCKNWHEAALKCFVFFLISQPLIYLIEIVVFHHSWALFHYYRYWFIITILTIPGAVIAFQLKKKNWLSVIILAVATSYLAYASILYLRTAISNFPHHLLSGLFCIALALFLIVVLLKERKHRIVSYAIVVTVLVLTIFVAEKKEAVKIDLDEGQWTYEIENPHIVDVIIEGDTVTFEPEKDGVTYVEFKNEKDEQKAYYVTVSGGNVFVNLFE